MERCWIKLNYSIDNFNRAYWLLVVSFIIGSDNGLSPDRHQAIIWANGSEN